MNIFLIELFLTFLIVLVWLGPFLSSIRFARFLIFYTPGLDSFVACLLCFKLNDRKVETMDARA